MKQEDARHGQRIRVNLPGVCDHGHVGTIKKVRGSVCSVHLDRNRRPLHLLVVYAGDHDLLGDDPTLDVPAPTNGEVDTALQPAGNRAGTAMVVKATFVTTNSVVAVVNSADNELLTT